MLDEMRTMARESKASLPIVSSGRLLFIVLHAPFKRFAESFPICKVP